ncbi:arginine synthesis PII-interacting regulator PirA [Coleofasciculus sp. F4-SAH-05]|uniref:arginine synthesis PII-interacting regulator PirA n=1 Tax=Coleofasciculus sp. F4-SAH-05 TaxID=3069525 RepID=UPI003304D9F3
MKRCYRGVHYDETPSTLDVSEGEIGGTYRGQNWRFHYLRHIPEPPPTHDLKWRGAVYHTGKPRVVKSTPVETPMTMVGTRSWFLKNSRQKAFQQTSITHLENICQSLERRLDVARAKGDQDLVRQLEKESEQITCPLR